MNEVLLRRAQKGDTEAIEQLMTSLEGLVWRVCWHYTGERESAADCGQETMVRIWKALPTYRQDCVFETWVYRIAANVCIDLLRKRKRERTESLAQLQEQGFDPPDPSPGTEETVLARENRRLLRDCIAALPEDQREALVMTQLEGVPYERAAVLLQTTEGTVKSRVSRAKERLRDMMEQKNERKTGTFREGKPSNRTKGGIGRG